MVGRERIEDRGKGRGPDRDRVARGSQEGAVRGGQQGQWLGVVLDLAADRDQDRLVGLDRADDVVAGDVGRGDDHDRRPVEARVEVEGGERRVRVGRADRRPVPGAREDQVVGVLGRAGQLGRPFAAERSRAAGTSRRDRAGLDHDGAGRLGPGRQLGQGPSSMATDSITGGGPKALECAPLRTRYSRTSLGGARPHREPSPRGSRNRTNGGYRRYHPRSMEPSSIQHSSGPSIKIERHE